MTETDIKIGPVRPQSDPLARSGGAAVSQGSSSISDPVALSRQNQIDIRALQDQIFSILTLLDQKIAVPMLIGSGANHQAGVVPDPGSTAGSSKYLNEDGTFSALTIATLPQLSRSLAYNSVVQSIPNTTNTPLTFDTNIQDVGGIHSTTVAPTRFTAVAAGWHMAIGQMYFAASAAGVVRQIAISINGAFVAPVPISNVPPNFITQVMSPLLLVIGDYVEFQVYQDSGGALNTNTNAFGALTFISR